MPFKEFFIRTILMMWWKPDRLSLELVIVLAIVKIVSETMTNQKLIFGSDSDVPTVKKCVYVGA